ncbi:hypothetical protein M409DRAFT_16498 [Zasmidium cellare ATCC 36951]|uniref:Major facilitator superfamily (MFS) profile domain-containing protein n=1 Tax=Zasmidium cellare ATCC 36951 TaxID=1080233 RepID=A0A6A6D5A4_ZASCE|nr:uncharacterized protein M409DRAFT_16498 [Zasmidium cellare ATCC 36951]KAF2174235.1 hypothetical protein M409DRAFT_16498 [Zasmidium cellare ATCC 36951]
MNRKNDAVHVEKKEQDDYSSQPVDESLPTTPLVVFFALFIALGGWLLNFDLTYSGTVLQMSTFRSSFGTCIQEHGESSLVCSITALQQSLTNISSLFIGLGAALSGLLGSWLGRRTCIQLGCLIQAVGAAGSMGTAGNYVAYVACKCITGVGLGLLYASTLPYGIEFMPPRRRGAMIALFNIGLSLGSNCIGVICLGSSSLKSNWAWKIPIICEIPVAAVYGTFIMLYPESPRWLVLHGRDEAAVEAFLSMYKGHMTRGKAEAIVASVKQNIESYLDMASSTTWTEIFRRHYFPRMLTAALVLIASIICGTFFVHTYVALFFGQLKVSQNPFVLNCIIEACSFPGACAGPFIAEGLGRRRAQLAGYAMLGSLMLIAGIVNTCLGSQNTTGLIVLITLLCLWSAIAAAFVTSTAWLLASELHSVRLRTYGQAFVMGVSFIFQFANNFYLPYMLNPRYGNMGVNITYFFFGISAAALVIVFFLVPETGLLSLKQLDNQWSAGQRAWQTSLRKNRTISARGQEFGLGLANE